MKTAWSPKGEKSRSVSSGVIAPISVRVEASIPLKLRARRYRARLPARSHLPGSALYPSLRATDVSELPLLKEGVDCVIRVGEPRDSTLVASRLGKFDFVTVSSAA